MILSVDSYFIGQEAETSFDMANPPGDLYGNDTLMILSVDSYFIGQGAETLI